MNLHKKSWFLIVAGSLPFLGLYLLTTNQNFTFDALTNAIASELNDPSRWLHSNHLLYPFLGTIWFRLERFLGYRGYSIYSLARWNSLLMALSMGLIFETLTRFVKKWKAAVLALLLGTSYSAWYYAVDAFAVGASVIFSAAVIALMIRSKNEDKTTPRDLIFLIACSTLYILAHAIAIFHIVAVAWWLSKREIKDALIYLGSVLLLLAFIYLSIFQFIIHPVNSQSFILWSLGYAGANGSQNIFKSIFWTFRLSDIYDGLWDGWTRSFLSITTYSSDGVRWLSNGIGISLFFTTLFSLKKSKELSAQDRIVFWSLILWGSIMTLFLAFWSPGHHGFRLHIIIPWAVAWGMAFQHSKLFFKYMAACGALIFIFNFSGIFYFDSFLQNNAGYQYLAEIKPHLREGDVLLCAHGSIPNIEGLRAYFFPGIMGGPIEGRLFEFREKDVTPLFRSIETSLHHHQVFFLDDVLDPAIQNRIEGQFFLPPGSIQGALNQYKLSPAFKLSNNRTVYAVHQK